MKRRQLSPRVAWWIIRLMVGSGLIMFSIGCAWGVRTSLFVTRAIQTVGTVTRVETGRGSKGGATFRPYFTYVDAQRVTHESNTGSSSSSYNYRPGDQVSVLYNSADPSRAQINEFMPLWFGPVFMTFFGLGYGGFAAFVGKIVMKRAHP